SSREKEEIFRNIFGTERIQSFQERLRIKARDLNKTYEEYGTRLDQSLANIEIEDEALADAVERTNYTKILEIIEKGMNKGNKELAKTKQEIEKLNKIEQKNDKWIQLLEEQVSLRAAKEELSERAEDIQYFQRALDLNAQAREVKQEQEKLEGLENEAVKLAEQLKDKKEASIEVKKALEKLLESQKASKQAEQQLDSIREAIQELENEKKIFEERDQKVQKILAIEKELQKAAKQMKDLEKNDGVYIEKIE